MAGESGEGRMWLLQSEGYLPQFSITHTQWWTSKQLSSQRGRRPFLALSTGNSTSIYVFVCPLSSCIQYSNAETEKYSPWISGKLWIAWLKLWIWVMCFCVQSAFYCCCVFMVPPMGSCSVLFIEFLCCFWSCFSPTQDLIQEINELRLRVGEMDNERLQYEKKLKTTKVSEAEGKKQRWV